MEIRLRASEIHVSVNRDPDDRFGSPYGKCAGCGESVRMDDGHTVDECIYTLDRKIKEILDTKIRRYKVKK